MIVGSYEHKIETDLYKNIIIQKTYRSSNDKGRKKSSPTPINVGHGHGKRVSYKNNILGNANRGKGLYE